MEILNKLKDATSGIKDTALGLKELGHEIWQQNQSNELLSQDNPQPPVQPSVSLQSTHDGLYNPQLEKLIDLALADGELTEQEKQILFKKAQSMNIDLGEFEMVLQAKLFEKQKEMNKELSATNTAAPKSSKYGDIRKCPQCGAVVDAFSAICSECGYAFNDVTNNSEVKILAKRLEELEEERIVPTTVEDTKRKITFGKVLLWYFFFWIIIPIRLVKAITGMISKSTNPKLWTTTDKKMEGVIMNFAIPNIKAELIEFSILCQSHIKKVRYFNWLTDEGGYNLKWNKVWKSKLDQIYSKSQIALRSDQTSLNYIKDIYDNVDDSLKKDRSSMLIIMSCALALIILLIVLICIYFSQV